MNVLNAAEFTLNIKLTILTIIMYILPQFEKCTKPL